MIALVWPFERGRYIHRLVARDGRVCLVERTSTHPDSRGTVHWEVVVLEHARERKVPGGTILPAAERYPSSAKWGQAGWTYTSRADAATRYDALVSSTIPPEKARGGGRSINSSSGRPRGD